MKKREYVKKLVLQKLLQYQCSGPILTWTSVKIGFMEFNGFQTIKGNEAENVQFIKQLNTAIYFYILLDYMVTCFFQNTPTCAAPTPEREFLLIKRRNIMYVLHIIYEWLLKWNTRIIYALCELLAVKKLHKNLQQDHFLIIMCYN